MTKLIEPHGGTLKEMLLGPEEAETIQTWAGELPCWELTERQLCDIELILNGGFSPLEGFMCSEDYLSVINKMRLADGTLWPIPITLDVDQEFANTLKEGGGVALKDSEGLIIAVMDISEIWTPDMDAEAKGVFGTNDTKHPAVNYLLNISNPVYLGGKIKGLRMPMHYDFMRLRLTPRDIREQFSRLGWNRVVAFQTRNPMHRAHQEITFSAAQKAEANLLIHPVVGMTKPGDIDHYSRVRCYEQILKHYPEQTTSLSLLPLAMRMGGPREALWHTIIRKNYGCTHIIVGRDHAGPGKDSAGNDFYGPYDAQELVAKHQEELGMEMVPFQMMVFVQEKATYVPIDETEDGQTVLNISGTEFRKRLMEGLDIPEWFSYPELVEELRRTHPPKYKQGFTVYFTGTYHTRKGPIARALMVKLLEIGGRGVTLLDCETVKKRLTADGEAAGERGGPRILRTGFVAAEVTKSGGVALCTPATPDAETRAKVRDMVNSVASDGGFLEVYVTGGDDKGDDFEVPTDADLEIDTRTCEPDEAAQRIVLKLEKLGYIK